MTNPVNPPPQLRIPQSFLKDREVYEYERQIGIILFQLWQRTGGDNDIISDLQNFNVGAFSSTEQWLQKQISGLPEFTCDTTGFKADSTEITADKVIA